MKKLLLSAAILIGMGGLNAQTPVGTVVNNFTLTDINGNSHSLFDYLDQGKMVVIDVSATWCGPCWSYHGTGALNSFYNAHGPSSAANDAMVFFIEGDVGTNTACLYGSTGCNDQTLGDWVTGENMPIIDLTTAASFENSGLEIPYYPVMYVICPNRTVLKSGTAGAIGTLSLLNSYVGLCPPPATEPIDPALMGYTGTTTSCSSFNLSVTLQNNGTTPLTSATISVTGIPSPINYNWTGNLNTYAVTQVNLGTVNLTSSATAIITITSTDGNTSNSTLTQPLSYIDPTSSVAVNTNQDFSNAAFPYANWQVLNPDNDITWEHVATLGGMLKINTYQYGPGLTGELDHFVTKAFNLSGQSNPSLLFKVANRAYDATYYDKLRVGVSTNCDGPFTQVYSKENAQLATGANLSNAFTPTSASDFRQECVNLNSYGNSAALFVRFTNDNNYGNNIYIDDISISSTSCTSGLDEEEQVSFEVFPNPATDVINIIFNAKTADYVVSLMDIQGRIVSTMNLNNASGSQTLAFGTENLAKGSYVVAISSNGFKTTKHVVIK